MTDQTPAAGSKAEQQREMGARLREARETLGITQEDAAVALGIPRTSITALEKGSRAVAATELTKMATLYRRPVAWLLGDEDPAPVATTALFRATASLSDADKEQVLRFAQFLATAGAPPQPDRKQ
ncbi:helix-turn-helix domain-containing protein [Curtobacterium sp. PhB136]|uniref:helix-turn-helix domain-containing protein n=1 Tax=Curtobacterium sp. PhB136 TaxID=2485181 RepID=UPI001042EF7D|nr:helix-turn-helix domain-containing protein [Curtobacterium sp. PhB136]TCK65832.1 helix-turn-helix protein [Curtobacterium sp. PhB136]